MEIVKPKSLAATLDGVNEAFFYNQHLLKFQREKVARWLANRQGLPGAYANMFAPTESDFKNGVRFFTGEKISSEAAIGHILGEEACRALILLNVSYIGVKNALRKASLGMMRRLGPSATRGMYCCGTCTAAYWRHLAAGGLKYAKRRLTAGMKILKQHRDGKGRWRSYPFYYTLLALNEIDLPSAIKEIRYTARLCEQFLKRSKRKDKITSRRRILAERILEKC